MSRTLGNTRLEVTPIGLGLAALGRPGYINLGHATDLHGHSDVASMERSAHAVLDAAYEHGVRYFDAARSYGRAEAFLGSWLEQRGFGPDDVTVGSKWGYRYTADWHVDAKVHEVKDLSVATLRRQIDESEELLGNHLRLYQIHSATVESGVLDDPEVLFELKKLRSSGMAIGFTATGPHQSETIERALEVGEFDAVQATYNLLERSAGPALAAAHAEGLGVIIKEALANGRLTTRGDVPELAAAARTTGRTEDAIALAYVLAQPWVDVVLSGATTVEQLESNLVALVLDPPELEIAGEEPETYWEERSELPWN
ncbi:MAG TPA: aldo/keto reductase [Solirubrobacteraceae bacterium]|nr:aldo/keto reductase [Solirubrobacteraceae bacterium]